MSFKLDNFWPFESFQCTRPGSDAALTKANGNFAISLIGVGKSLSQAVPIQAMAYFAQVKVFALVDFFFLIAIFFIIICIIYFHYYLSELKYTVHCTNRYLERSLPRRACNVNRKIRESWQAKKENCAEGTQLAWNGRQG